jgi:hypothetical protein
MNICFNAKNAKNPKEIWNEFQWTTKHFLWQDYFLHMWPTSKATHFEPIEHNFSSIGFLNESFALQPFPSKFQDFESFVWFGFSSSSSNEHVVS